MAFPTPLLLAEHCLLPGVRPHARAIYLYLLPSPLPLGNLTLFLTFVQFLCSFIVSGIENASLQVYAKYLIR